MRYDDASNTGSMAAADSAPTARPDVEFLPQGDMGPATGNAITGAGTQSGANGADQVGDAPARIVEVNSATGPAAATGNGFQANGQYGVLNMDAQGNFSYVRNGGTPDGVQDVFGYTLADRDGSTSSSTLTVNIGRDLTLEAMGVAQGVVNLPPGVELSDIRVVGRDLVITMPDGTTMVIPGGAVFVPQLVIGDVEVPATNLAALLVNSEPQPAAGLVPSSGGNFAAPVPPLDPGVPLGDLIPPTELVFTPPEFEEPGQFIDDEPEIIIDPVDGEPAVNAVSDVNEAGLPVRSGPEPEGTGEEAAAGDNGDASETTTGVIDITSPDGIGSVTINGVLVTGTVGQTIAGDFGTLTITGFLPDGDIQYSYTLADNTIGDGTHDDFEVTITDEDGDSATGTLTINIINDAPIARDDTDSLAEGASSTDGNVLTAVGTTNSGADSPGADGFSGETNDDIDGVTGIRPGGGTGGSFTAVAQTGAGVTVAGTFGNLTIHNDGSYTYTLNGNQGAGGTDVFTYQVTDGDGNVDTATLTISVPPDSVPVANNANAIVDDDGLPAGNGDSAPGDDVVPNTDGDNNEATFSGQLTADFGSDGPGTFSFAAGTNGQVVTIGQEQVTYSVAGNVLTATVSSGARSGTELFTVTLNANGTYDVELLANVLHVDDGTNTENNASAGINFIATDSDGDTDGAILTITFDDDVPTVRGEGFVGGLVDEDNLPNGNDDSQTGDDDPGNADGDNDGTTTGGAAGSLTALFNVGADEPMTLGLSSDTSGLPALFSGGVAVTYSVVGNVLTASAGGSTVFTLTVNPDGSWVFDLEGQLDHATGNNENNLLIDFSSILTAEDADGDEANVPAGSFVVNVDDDVPVPANNEGSVTGLVDEDDLPTGNGDNAPGDDDPGNADGDNDGTTTSGAAGSLTALYDAGADQPLTIGLSSNTSGLPALFSGGVAVTYSVVGNVLTASAGGNTVFTLTVNGDGSWTFDLEGQLDHVSGNSENNLFIDFSSVITAVDFDGDPAAPLPAGSFRINVDDDIPTPKTPNEGQPILGGLVDEDNLPDGNNDVQTGDDNPGNADGDNDGTTTGGNAGSLAALFNAGADQPLTFSMNASTAGLPALFSGGVAVTYSVVGNVLTASAGGSTVFTFTINADGSWVFDLQGQLDHPAGNNENNLSIDLSSMVQAVDKDGDPATAAAGALVVSVDDDLPVPANEGSVTGLVDEDDLPTGNDDVQPGDDDPGNADGDNDGTTTSGAAGSLATLYSVGADDPLSFGLSTNTSGLPALFSGGVAVTYSVVGNVLTASAGGNTVFTLTVNADGSWTFDLEGQLDHASGNSENNLTIDLSSIIEAEDFDGDPATALPAGSFVITVDDDIPTPKTPVEGQPLLGGLVDEDNLPTGNNDVQTGDDNPGNADGDNDGTTTGGAAGSLGALFNAGADQPLTFSMNASTAGLPALFSKGVAVTYSVVGNVLTASAGGNTVFTFTVNADGSWVFDLQDQLDHPAGNNENNLSIDLSSMVQAVDKDGDPATAAPGALVISVDDDIPVPKNNEGSVTGIVDEDNLPAGNNDNATGDDDPGNADGDNDGTTTGGAAGSLNGLYNVGADEPLTIGLSTNTSGLPALFSGGIAVTYNVVGNVLTASAGGNTVFTLTVNANGSWTFDLVRQLDHATGNNENNLFIDFSSVITARDFDNDQAPPLPGGSFVINVDDDVPIARNDADEITGGGTTATGNVITGASTTGGAAGADSTGADAPITIVAIQGTGGTDTTFSGGFLSIGGAHGTLQIDANGNYTYTRTDNLGGVNDVFTYTIRDADGDERTATLTINIEDNVPTANTPAEVWLDDDTETGGNAGGDGDRSPDTQNATGFLTGTGGDGDLDFFLQPIVNQTPPAGFTYAFDGAAPAGQQWLIISQGGTPVIRVELVNETGAYTVTQLAAIDHAEDGDTEGEIPLGNIIDDINVSFVARDADGDDSPPKNLTITVDDDTPVNNAGTVSITVHEDALAGGNATGEGAKTTTASITTAQLQSLVSPGADSPVTIGINAAIDGVATGETQGGVSIVWDVVSPTQVRGLVGGDATKVAFTLTFDAVNNEWDFVLLDNVDNNNDGNLLTGEGDADTDGLSLANVFTATDADGDTVIIDAGATVNIENDVPTAAAVQLGGTVDEDGVLEGVDDDGPGDGIPGNGSGGSGDFPGEPTQVTGNVSTLFNPGADAPLTYIMNPSVASLTAQGLTSAGVALSYNVVFAAGVYTLTASTPAGTVFTLTLNASTGAYQFTLVDQLDHANALNENDLTIALGAMIQARDTDGDLVTANANALNITVDDDSPTMGTIADSSASNDATDPPTVGALNFEVGADEPAIVTAISVDIPDGTTSGGKGIVTNVVGNVLTAYQDANGSGTYDAGDTVAVFTLTVNPNAGTTGQYVFDLITPLDPETIDTPIGGSSSFGAGPTLGQVLETATGTDLSVISGYHASGTFNFAAWHASGSLSAANTTAAGVNGSTSGWGVDDNNFNNETEIMFFDFGDEPLSDPDGAEAFVPPATTLPQISFATFDFINYNDGAGNAGDDIAYVVRLVDAAGNPAGVVSGWVPDFAFDGSSNAAATNWTFSAPAGTFIGDIQFYSGANPDGSVQDLAPGKIDLVSVGVTTTNLDVDLNFDVTITDRDGDPVSGSFTVNIGEASTLAATSFAATSGLADSGPETSSLVASNDNVEQQKQANTSNTTVLAGALAAAGLATEPLAAHDRGSDRHEGHEDRGGKAKDAAQPVAEASQDGGAQSSGLLGAAAAKDADKPAESKPHENAAAEDKGVSNEDAPAPAVSELSQGTDSPQSEVSQPAMAESVGMPSAEQLIAAAEAKSVEGKGADKEVGKVIADALDGGGNGKDLDALINAVTGQMNAEDALASHGGNAVSNGDMGAFAGLAAAHSDDIMTQMTMHQDAAPAAA